MAGTGDCLADGSIFQTIGYGMPDSKLPVVLVAQLAICAFIRGAHRYKFIKIL